jgi:hypothetical protein
VHYVVHNEATRISPTLVKLGDFSATQQCLFGWHTYEKIKGFAADSALHIDRYLGTMSTNKKFNAYCVLPFTSVQSNGMSHLRNMVTCDEILFKKCQETLLKLPIKQN